VGFLAFALGVLLCLPTVYVLVLNGANLGVALGLFAAVGEQPKFWGLILPHGLLELTAVFVAGATGLRLGWTIVDPGDRPRLVALAEEGRRAIVVVVGLIAGVLAEVVFVTYAVVEGRAAAAQGLTGALGEDRAAWTAADPESTRLSARAVPSPSP